MAFGFGFNKAKVLATAEKYVQQGKLHHAVTEYEKIVEKDPKDLTVLNTIGDLYARLGQADKASEYFKRVGDSYATEGFTVKAIAMYKKLTKLNPGAIPVVQRLAELYTQQGLYNDARQQYLQLADGCLKNNDMNGAIRIFQKMLEMDPDNVSLQNKLSDLYVKAGKKAEARDLLLKVSMSLFDRGSIEQADEVLNRMLALDPSNMDALMMRGKIALDAGNGASAARYLEKVPNIDSRADGLQPLLRAYILSGNTEGAEGVARKLASVHNDLSGIRAYADHLLAAGRSDDAMTIYDEFVDRLIVGDSGELTFALQGLTGQVRENPASLEKLRSIFQKAGAVSNIPEVNELLAHSYVKAGDLAKARDLYKELAELEPTNTQHMQNYRQVLKRMGEEPTARPLASGEASQALFVEEIDSALPPMPDYPAPLLEKISNALTDAELFESYNKPQQAVQPLESILQQAPQDVRINQRLVSVYGKVGRLEDAARCCDTLKHVFLHAEMETEAHQWAEMAARFRHQAGVPAVEEVEAPLEFPVAPATPAAAAETTEITAEAFATAATELPAMPLEPGEAHEIDLSSEWEAAVAEPVAEVPVKPAPAESPVKPTAPKEQPAVHPSAVSDLLEEIKFYISQQMWDEARSAIARCEQVAPASFELAQLKSLLGVASEPQTEPAEADFATEAAQEASPEGGGTVMEYDFATAIATQSEESTEAAPAAEVPAQEIPAFEIAPAEPSMEEFAVAQPQAEEIPAAELAVAELPVAEPEPTVEEAAFEEEVTPEAVAAWPEPVEEEVAEPAPEPVAELVAAPEEKDVLSDMVLDLETALGDDFGVPPVATPEKPIAAAAVAAAAMPIPGAPPSFEIAASAAPVVVAPVVAAQVASPAVEEPVLTEESSVLSDLFAEFKEEVGEAAEEKEDPETHYNLGVAFKEMGLLDEAIGELQKVCKAIDRGAEFGQVMQAYTWLAGCFVEKGVPEASVKWYEKALGIAESDESRTALHYDLACAFEAAGNRPLALKHFTEVYGTNIDYRDVAERIKALKS